MIFENEWPQLIKSIDRIKSDNEEIEFYDNSLAMLVVGEDHRFWKHFGVDPIGLGRGP